MFAQAADAEGVIVGANLVFAQAADAEGVTVGALLAAPRERKGASTTETSAVRRKG